MTRPAYGITKRSHCTQASHTASFTVRCASGWSRRPDGLSRLIRAAKPRGRGGKAAILPRNIPMIAIMWQFDVKNGREAEFEQLYGVDGEWTAMNRHTRSYLGSSFLHDQNRSSRYIVIEYWSEMIVHEQDRASRSAAIASLERRRTTLVESVEPLGIFTALNVPDRTGPTWSQRR